MNEEYIFKILTFLDTLPIIKYTSFQSVGDFYRVVVKAEDRYNSFDYTSYDLEDLYNNLYWYYREMEDVKGNTSEYIKSVFNLAHTLWHVAVFVGGLTSLAFLVVLLLR